MARQPLKKTAAPAPLEAEVYLTLLHAADSLLRPTEETLKAAGLSHTQYNVLRILRGASRGMKTGEEQEGLPCGEIAARMITRDPDITRLLDRLEARGLVIRTREKRDRRVVQARITVAGLQLLKGLDKPVADLHKKMFQHMSAKHLRQLATLLKEVRDAALQTESCEGQAAD